MRRGGQGKRRDGNEMPIIRALQAVGASVAQLSGADLPDLLVGYCGGNWLMEIKQVKAKLKPGQEQWQLTWRGNVNTVREPAEALKLIGCKARVKA